MGTIAEDFQEPAPLMGYPEAAMRVEARNEAMEGLLAIFRRMTSCLPFWKGRSDTMEVILHEGDRWTWRRLSPDSLEIIVSSGTRSFPSRRECVEHLERSGWIWGGYTLIDKSNHTYAELVKG